MLTKQGRSELVFPQAPIRPNDDRACFSKKIGRRFSVGQLRCSSQTAVRILRPPPKDGPSNPCNRNFQRLTSSSQREPCADAISGCTFSASTFPHRFGDEWRNCNRQSLHKPKIRSRLSSCSWPQPILRQRDNDSSNRDNDSSSWLGFGILRKILGSYQSQNPGFIRLHLVIPRLPT